MVNKVSNQKLLFWILILFSILFICIGIISFLYFKEVKELFLESLNQKVCIADINTQKISYESFISNYYSTQSNWLTVWLTFTGILLTIVTIIMPILSMKNNEKQEEHLEKLCDRALDSIKKAEDAQKEVEIAKENMKTEINTQNQKIEKDIKEIKNFVDKVNESEKQTKINRLFTEAMNLSNQKLYNDSLNKYNEVLKLDPDNWPALNNIGIIYINQKKYDEALQYFNQALNIYTDDITLGNICLVLIQQGKYNEAIINYNKCIKLNPKEKVYYYNLTEVYILTDKIKQATETLEKYCAMKDCYIYSDDKEKWKDVIKDSTSTQEQKDKINTLIDSLREEPRNS